MKSRVWGFDKHKVHVFWTSMLIDKVCLVIYLHKLGNALSVELFGIHPPSIPF